jgi:hypothetical protein
MEKSIEEQIYPKEGKRIPQETSRIARGEPWSSGITLGHQRGVGEEERKKKGWRGMGGPYIGQGPNTSDISDGGRIYPIHRT